MMAANLDCKNARKSIRKSGLDLIKKQTGKVEERLVAGVVLIVAFVGLMGGFFWTSHRVEKARQSIETEILSPHDDIFGIIRGTGGRGWAVGKNGTILHSTDQGRSWKLQASGTSQAILAVSFADDRVGFVVGSSGTILRTRDGGLSWEKQSSGIKDNLFGVWAFSKTEACAVGSFGTLVSTSDGGATWTKYKFPWEKLIPRLGEEIGGLVEPHLYAVHFVTPAIGWIVGEFGLVLHTRDGGQTWTSQRSGAQLGQLFGVIFRDERTGWAVGQGGASFGPRTAGSTGSESSIKSTEIYLQFLSRVKISWLLAIVFFWPRKMGVPPGQKTSPLQKISCLPVWRI